MKKKTAYTLTTGYYPKSVVFGVVKDVTLSVSIAIIIYFEITKVQPQWIGKLFI